MSIEQIAGLPTIAERVTAARIRAGYESQDQFAQAIGMRNRRGISRIENGVVPENYREAISRVTGLPVISMQRASEPDRLAALEAVVWGSSDPAVPSVPVRLERLEAALELILGALDAAGIEIPGEPAGFRSSPSAPQSRPRTVRKRSSS